MGSKQIDLVCQLKLLSQLVDITCLRAEDLLHPSAFHTQCCYLTTPYTCVAIVNSMTFNRQYNMFKLKVLSFFFPWRSVANFSNPPFFFIFVVEDFLYFHSKSCKNLQETCKKLKNREYKRRRSTSNTLPQDLLPSPPFPSFKFSLLLGNGSHSSSRICS